MINKDTEDSDLADIRAYAEGVDYYTCKAIGLGENPYGNLEIEELDPEIFIDHLSKIHGMLSDLSAVARFGPYDLLWKSIHVYLNGCRSV